MSCNAAGAAAAAASAAAPAGHEIPIQAPGQTEPAAGGAPTKPAVAEQAAEAGMEIGGAPTGTAVADQAAVGKPGEPEEAPAGGEAASGATEPEEAAERPAGSPSKE